MEQFNDYVPPSWDEYFMLQAYLVASKSKDPSTKIGTVLVKNKIVISQGYNGFPCGVDDSKERYEDRSIKYELVSHSEFNSVVQCARLGISTNGAICYTQGVPCSNCCKALIQGGIKEIVTHENWERIFYKNTPGNWEESAKYSILMAKEAGVTLRKLSGYFDVNTWLVGKMYNV